MLNAAVCMLAGCLLAAQVDANQGDLAPTVARLVRQLDASEKAKRDEAEQELLKLGGDVLPLLPESERASAEVKLRLARVRTQLETLRGEEQVKGREISLAGDALSLQDVIAAVAKQTGDKLVDFREEFGQQADPKTIKVQLDKVPFWPALDQILDAAGMTVYEYAGEPGLALVNRAGGQRARYNRGTYAGAFRIEATELTARRDLRDPNGQSLRLAVEVAWEPRLQPIAITQAADAVKAVGDTGMALSSMPDGELEATINPGESSVQVPIVFSLPPRQTAKIATLQGAFDVLLPGPVEEFRFEKLQAGGKGEQRRAGVKVIVDQVRQNNLVWEVRTRVVFDKPGQALESHRTWVLHNEALLRSPSGETINYAGLETTRQTDNEVGVAYLFDVADIAGHTFIYKTPAVLMNTSVPYELRDIPLP